MVMKDARKNPYEGVNAHVQSYAQNNKFGAWKMWHGAYIDDIARALDAQLPPGYEVGMITSLQIGEYHPDSGERIRRPEPDVTVYDVDPTLRSGVSKTSGQAPTLELPAIRTLRMDDEVYLTGIMIYRIVEEDERVPVTRIEVLSPTNKPPGDGYIQYAEKRDATLAQQMPLIEVDFLHESRPVPRHVPSYPDGQPESYPCSIYVTDTRAGLDIGTTKVYGFNVDEAVPLIDIPLAGEEKLTFDFAPPYNRVYEQLSYFRNRVDYAKEPLGFETYSQADRERIRTRMAIIAGQQS